MKIALRAVRAAVVGVLLAVLAAHAGCIERSYVIRSDPPGARVVVDGEDRGLAPVEKQFLHYGTRQVILSKEGHQRLTVRQRLDPPWYERFPIDFVVEMVLPWTVHDRRVFTYRLKPLGEFDKDALVDRAEKLKKRVGVFGEYE